MSKFLKALGGNDLGSGPVKETNLESIIDVVNSVVSSAIGILTAGVVILAIFIAFKFFTADDDTKRKNAKAQLIYCIIGIIVLLALLILAPNVVNMIEKALE